MGGTWTEKENFASAGGHYGQGGGGGHGERGGHGGRGPHEYQNSANDRQQQSWHVQRKNLDRKHKLSRLARSSVVSVYTYMIIFIKQLSKSEHILQPRGKKFDFSIISHIIQAIETPKTSAVFHSI